MKLKKLIENLPLKVYGNKEIEITGLCSHSKRIAPGNLFIMKKGHLDDGYKHIQEAIANGATVLLSSFFDPFLKDTVQLIADDVVEMEGILASRFFDFPSQELFTVGITGTSGKTTTSFLLKHMFETFGMPTGIVGTIAYIFGSHHLESELTTPDTITNQKLLREMVKSGCSSCVMEVSSHGLAQKRILQTQFDTALFLNLSQDHLDYHGSLENYAKEKAKLFSYLKKGGHAVLNIDSPWTPFMLSHIKEKICTFGLTPNADLYADNIVLNERGTSFRLHFCGKERECRWDLIGRFNIYNCLAASAVCLLRGIPFEELPMAIQTFQNAPGRLEKVKNKAGLHIFVDYAHKPDALEKVLLCLQEIKKGKIIVVFGCGGDRDKMKRPVMGEIAEKFADFSILTSDNPRSEDPLAIIEEIKKGFSQSKKCIIEADRRKAIELAIEKATDQDLILIAGKGHEKYQIFSHQTLPFDDRKVAQELLND